MGPNAQRSQRKFLHAMLANASVSPTQDELAHRALIGPRTVTNVTRALRAPGVEILAPTAKESSARFGKGVGVTLALSVGSQSVHGALADANGDLHYRTSADPPTPGQLAASHTTILGRIRSVAGQVLQSAFEDREWLDKDGVLKTHGVAVAWPSPLDRQKRPRGWTLSDRAWKEPDDATGEVRTIPEWIAHALGDPFGTDRCHAVRDVNAHSICLAFQEAQEKTPRAITPDDDWRLALVLRIGQGLAGSSMLLAPANTARLSFIDSLLIEGTNGFAGSLGHLSIDKKVVDDLNADSLAGLPPINYDGAVCSCGKKHHLQAFASVPGILRRLEKSHYRVPVDGPSQARLLTQAREGRVSDAVPVRAGVDVGRLVGHAMAGPILLLDPSTVTITGPLAGDPVIKGVQGVRSVWGSTIDDSVKIGTDQSDIGDFIGVKGAALAVIRRVVFRDFLDHGLLPLRDALNVTSEDVRRLRGT